MERLKNLIDLSGSQTLSLIDLSGQYLSMSVCDEKFFVRINIYHSDECDSSRKMIFPYMKTSSMMSIGHCIDKSAKSLCIRFGKALQASEQKKT